MSSSDKPQYLNMPVPMLPRRGALLGFLALAGCGFSPVYGPGGAAGALRGRVVALPPADAEGFAFVRRIEDRFGAPETGDLTLAAEIFISEEAVGFLPDGTISRYNVEGRADWSLDTVDGTRLSGSERAFTAYSATSTTVATIVARRDARARLMTILADSVAAAILARSNAL